MSPLEKAWEHYGGRLVTNRQGKNKACCPLHEDKAPSASVDIGAQKWVCHAGCGYGDIYELVMLADGITSFPEAKAFADERFGTTATAGEVGSTKGKKRPGRRKPLWVGE